MSLIHSNGIWMAHPCPSYRFTEALLYPHLLLLRICACFTPSNSKLAHRWFTGNDPVSPFCPSPFITGLLVMNGVSPPLLPPCPFITSLLTMNVVLTSPSFSPPLTHSPDWLW